MTLLLLLLTIEHVPFRIEQPLYAPITIRVDGKNQLWILDQDEASLFTFKPNGQLVSRFGRKGQGPSEFNNPSGFDFLADGRILIVDSGNRRLQFFDGSGSFLLMIPITDHNISQVLALPDGTFILTESNGRNFSITLGEDPSTKRRFYLYNANGTLRRSFGTYQHHANPLLANMLNQGALAQKDGRILFASAMTPLLIWYHGDKEVKLPYPLLFQPEKPQEKMITQKEHGENVVSMAIKADQICLGLSLLRDGDILILRTTGPTVIGEGVTPSQLVRLRPDGTVRTTYPGHYKALTLAVSPDNAYAYLVMEDGEESVFRVSLK